MLPSVTSQGRILLTCSWFATIQKVIWGPDICHVGRSAAIPGFAKRHKMFVQRINPLTKESEWVVSEAEGTPEWLIGPSAVTSYSADGCRLH